jgi:Glycosyltransferase family 28 N-terminal domain
MKLAALTYGTEGDTRPMAAVCRALMDAGHDVTLLADGGTLGNARDLGVPHAALAGNIRGALERGILSAVAGKNSLNATAKAMARIANENANAWMHQVLEVAAGSDGLIVAGLAAFIGFSAAEKLAIPVIGAGMIPLTPTSAFPSPFLPRRSTPRWLNRFSYRLVAEVLWRAFRNATNAARAQVGLPPGRKIWSGHPMLYGISPSLLPKPADWPDNAWMCGQWVRPVREWDAPRSLQDFLRGRRADLCGIRQHGGFRSARAVRYRDCCRGRPACPLLSRLDQRGFAEATPEFLCHWEYPARLVVPQHVLGHSSRRVWDHPFCSPCRCAFGRSAFCSRSILLGRTVTPERHSTRRSDRPEGHNRHLVSCDRCRSNGRDAGASFGDRRNDAR